MEQTAGQSSGSNIRCSNRQKVQLNTDFLKQKHGYLYRNGGMIKTKRNELNLIKIIKREL
jgi:hypothetical protein